MGKPIESTATSIASLSLITRLIVTLRRSGVLSKEDCDALFEAAILDNKNVNTPVNDQAASLLVELSNSIESVSNRH